MSFAKSRRHRSRHASWRSVLSLLLVALVAFAPIVRAVCDLEHIATTASSIHDGATDRPASPGSGGADACCDDTSVSMATEARTAAADGKAAISLPTVHPASVGSSFLALTSGRHETRGLQRPSLPPYEPPFRRVRKLLI